MTRTSRTISFELPPDTTEAQHKRLAEALANHLAKLLKVQPKRRTQGGAR